MPHERLANDMVRHATIGCVQVIAACLRPEEVKDCLDEFAQIIRRELVIYESALEHLQQRVGRT